MELRLPNISGTDREQLVQIRSYLYQLVPQLQWALNNVEASNNVQVEKPTPKSLLPSTTLSEASAQATFNSIKALIIKSSDIVDAYYERINRTLEGAYVAQSDFGTFVERTSQQIEETSTSTTQKFENLQIIIDGHAVDLASVEGSLQTIGEDLQIIGQDLSYTQNNIVNINRDIESLDGSVASLEGGVAYLDSTLRTTKQELSSSIAGVDESLQNAKTELTGKVDEVDADLQSAKTDVNERIDDTNGSVAGLGKGLNDANNKLADVNKDLQNSKAIITDGIQSVQAGVTGVNALLEDAKAQLRGSIDDIEAYVSSLEQTIIGVSAYLKSGLLYTTDAGIPVYGLEIGQSVRDAVAGTEVFNKYARFTSEKLSFYDSNGYEVAYISDKKLLIKMAEITVSLQIGKLVDLVMDNGDVVTKWVGG